MGGLDVLRAVHSARVAVGAPADAEYSCRLVTRLDAGRRPYLLVGLTVGPSGWVAAVSEQGVVQGWATDPDGAHAWWTLVEEDLVWAPGSWSRSPLYPLRRIAQDEEVILLDHNGQRVSQLPPHPG
jgi:hypothetical protein